MKPKPYILLKDGKPTSLRFALKSTAVNDAERLNRMDKLHRWTWEKRDG